MMKIKITLLLLLVCGFVSAQSWSPAGAKTRFTNGLGIPVKTITSPGAADTALIFINLLDTSTVYWRFHGALLPIGGSTSVNIYNTSSFLTGNRILDINDFDFTIQNTSTVGNGSPLLNFDMAAQKYYFGSSGSGGFDGMVVNGANGVSDESTQIFYTGSKIASFGNDGSSLAGIDLLNSVFVGFSGTSENSAILQVSSQSKGLLIPRMLKAERDLISSPATSLLIYQTDNTPGFYYYNGAAWVALSGASSLVIPNTEIVVGTGTGVGSTPDFTYENGDNNRFVVKFLGDENMRLDGDNAHFDITFGTTPYFSVHNGTSFLDNPGHSQMFGFNTSTPTEAVTVEGNVIPATTATHQIGTSSNHWLKGYIDTLYTLGSSIHLGNAHLTDSGYAAGKVLQGSNSGNATWVTPSTDVTSVSGTTNRVTSTGGTTPVIDISASYVGQSSITTLGTIGTGVWQGTLVGSTYGGTGVNNGSSTITLGGSLVTSGAFTTTLTATATTGVTLPTTGTLATLAGTENLSNKTFITRLNTLLTTEQIRSQYDASNYMSVTTAASGSTTFALTGTSPSYGFNTSNSIITRFQNTAVTNGYVDISSTATGVFRLLNNGGYGISINPAGSDINAPSADLKLRTQAVNTLNLFIGYQGINPTTSRTFVKIEPDPSIVTAFAPTTGATILYDWWSQGLSGFQPTSGTASFNYMRIHPTYNTTGTYSGTVMGLDYDPVNTSLTGATHISIRTVTGNEYFNTTSGNLGIGIASGGTLSARLMLGAGTATASTAPLKLTAGTLLSTIEGLTTEANASSIYQSSVALNRYALGGTITDFTSDANNTGTGETDLYTYTTKASTLSATGEKVIFEVAGTFNDITATSQLQFYFAGTNIGNTGALTVSATGGWSARVIVIRTGASTARAIVNLSTPGASTAVYTTETDLTGLTFTNTNIIKVTGTAGGAGGGSSDITGKLGTIFWYGASNN